MKLILKVHLDELVFRARNRAYGAYRLRQTFPQTTAKAGASAGLLLLLLLAWPREEPKPPAKQSEGGRIDVFEMPLPPLEKDVPAAQEEPAAPTATAPPPRGMMARPDIVLEIVSSDAIPEPNVHLTAPGPGDAIGADPDGNPFGLSGLPGGLPSGTGVAPGTGRGLRSNTEAPIVNEWELPHPPRPVNLDILQKQLSYPQLALDMGMNSADVILRVLVSPSGTVDSIQVLNSPHKLFVEQPLKLAGKLRFTPGIMNNQPVRVWVNVPFKYRTR